VEKPQAHPLSFFRDSSGTETAFFLFSFLDYNGNGPQRSFFFPPLLELQLRELSGLIPLSFLMI